MIVTKQSHTIRKALHENYQKRIAAALEDKAIAKSQGDLSENFGYVEAMKECENLRRMQADLGLNNPEVQVVDPTSWADIDMEGVPRAMVGALLEIETNGAQKTILLGGAWDADLKKEDVIPYTCPLGAALIPKSPGKEVPFNGGTVKILSVEVPTKERLQEIYGPIKTKTLENNRTEPGQPEMD
jgi:transcription elongation GreA/GreB family factor